MLSRLSIGGAVVIALFVILQQVDCKSVRQVKKFTNTKEAALNEFMKLLTRTLEDKEKKAHQTRSTEFTYNIYVHTGDKWGAGTDASVYIYLYGDLGSAGPIELYKYDAFERDDRNSFIVQAANVGSLNRIRIGHDNRNIGAGWYLAEVDIYSPQLGKQWEFPCNRWLADDEDDGKIERELYPANAEPDAKTCNVYVHTGDVFGAGTDANVYITIYGKTGDTGTVALTKSDMDGVFERNAIDEFTVDGEGLGDLTKLRVWHDDSGIGSGWFLETVRVYCVESGKRWDFLAGRWLATDEDDGAIDREFLPTLMGPNGEPQCGIPYFEPHSSTKRVIGGREAVPHSWPWQVSVRKPSFFHLCGGTIISKRWVVTSATCLHYYEFDPDGVSVVLGDHDRDSDDGEVDIDVLRVIPHPQFVWTNDVIDYDIALLELWEDIPWSQTIKPVCLTRAEPTDGQQCVVTGWGDTKGTANEDILQEADVPVLTQSECTSFYGSELSEREMCAGYPSGGKDACQKDHGGPLVCQPSDMYALYGIVQRYIPNIGYKCGEPYFPSTYTRVAKFVDWIQETTDNAGQIIVGDDLEQETA